MKLVLIFRIRKAIRTAAEYKSTRVHPPSCVVFVARVKTYFFLLYVLSLCIVFFISLYCMFYLFVLYVLSLCIVCFISLYFMFHLFVLYFLSLCIVCFISLYFMFHLLVLYVISLGIVGNIFWGCCSLYICITRSIQLFIVFFVFSYLPFVLYCVTFFYLSCS